MHLSRRVARRRASSRSLAGRAPRGPGAAAAHRRAGAERHPPGRRLSAQRADRAAARGTRWPSTPAASRRCARWRCSTPASSPTHPKIQKSLDYLRGLKLDKTYTVVAANDGPVRRRAAPRPAAHPGERPLARSACRSSRASARAPGRTATTMGGDNSNTQFAVLALHEAERVGAKVDPRSLAAGRRLLEARARTPTARGATSPASPARAA